MQSSRLARKRETPFLLLNFSKIRYFRTCILVFRCLGICSNFGISKAEIIMEEMVSHPPKFGFVSELKCDVEVENNTLIFSFSTKKF